MRRLWLWLAWLSRADGQIKGAICYHPEGAKPDDPKLCVPRFAKAPPVVKTHPEIGWRGSYQFKKNMSNGKHVYMNFSASDPEIHDAHLDSYNLHDICVDAEITMLGASTCIPSPAHPCPPPSPAPLYSNAKTAPRGCQPISPLPTLMKQLDLDLILVWLVLMVLLFYALAMVCEEFLVPAINILCVRTGIPDDVAGATLLAAGCNSPEFFASIIGIFVADSTVGVGTVVGSAPFNLCCITGGAALAMGGCLWLDPWLMARELFGLLSVFLLFLIFMDDYIVVWWEALTMVLFYALVYVPLLANFDKVKGFLLKLALGNKYSGAGSNAMLGDDDPNILGISAKTGSTKLEEVLAQETPSARAGVTTPAQPAAFEGMLGAVAKSLSESLAGTQRVTFGISDMLRENAADAARRQYAPMLSDTAQIELQPVAMPKARPGDGTTLEAGGVAESTMLSDLVEQCRKRCAGYEGAEAGFEGVLLKKPRGYVKVRVRAIAWQERYFKLDKHPTNPLRYSHKDQKTKFVTLPLQHVSHIERIGLDEMHLTTPAEVFKLRLPPGEPPSTMQRWFDQIVIKIDELGYSPPPPTELVGGLEEDEHHRPWYEMPDSALGQVVHCFTFLIKAAVFTTTPNVLVPGKEKYYPLTILVSMFWLAVFAILMTDVIEYFGCGIGVDSTVMGLSLGAVGTSFPNLYASILVARAGQGGMAVCQAIASNTFNICICLGLLWLMHTLGLGQCDYGSHGALHASCNGYYAPSGFRPLCPFLEGTNNAFGSAAGSTKGAVIFSLFWCAGFLVTMFACKLYVRKLPAYLMFAAYGVYILYQLVAAFAPGDPAICFHSVNICF